MPTDENRVDRHEAELTAHTQRSKEIGLSEPNHRDVQHAAHFQKAGLLKMTDHECIVTRTLGFQRMADDLGGAAEFRQRMEMPVGRIETMHFKHGAWCSGRIEEALEPFNVRRLLGGMDEALIPDANRLPGHAPYPSAETRSACLLIWVPCCGPKAPEQAIPAPMAAPSASSWRSGWSAR